MEYIPTISFREDGFPMRCGHEVVVIYDCDALQGPYCLQCGEKVF